MAPPSLRWLRAIVVCLLLQAVIVSGGALLASWSQPQAPRGASSLTL